MTEPVSSAPDRGDTHWAASYLAGDNLSPRTLDKWRTQGRGPRWVKIGSKVLYERADLDAYREACRRRSTSEVAA